MPGCAAFGCSNRTENGYSLKVFPRDPERRALWTAMVNRKNWTPTNTSYICEKHFDNNQWEVIRVDGKKKLKANAVPTIFEVSRKRNLNIKKKQVGKCKGLEKPNDHKSATIKAELECLVCCRSLATGQEVNLSSQTTTSRMTMQQWLMGLLNNEAETLQSINSDIMGSLCHRCSRLINYVDKIDAEVALLKNAISGCLQVKSLNGDNKQLEADFTSHLFVLDQFESDTSGTNVDESKPEPLEQDRLSPVDENKWNQTEISSEWENLSQRNSSMLSVGLPFDWEKVPRKDMRNVAIKHDYQCQICLIKTTSRSVLFFHLRKHMATFQWCDFCDVRLKSIKDETDQKEDISNEIVGEMCNGIS